MKTNAFQFRMTIKHFNIIAIFNHNKEKMNDVCVGCLHPIKITKNNHRKQKKRYFDEL